MFLDKLYKSLSDHEEEVAFVIQEQPYTYSDIRDRISKYCRLLSVQLKTPQQPVGVVVHDHIDAYAQIIALWFHGGVYVPLHPSFPTERNDNIRRRAGVELVLDPLNAENLSALAWEDIEVFEHDADELLYVLFTSGSTGQPKGVPISYSNFDHFIASFGRCGFSITSGDRCLQAFDLVFDVAIQSFVVPLLYGGTVYTVPHEAVKGSYILGLLERERLTFAAVAPSLLKSFEPLFDRIVLPDMRTMIVTAEASDIGLINAWQPCVPHARLYNFYGPTECTIYATYYKIPSTDTKHHHGKLAIGQPLLNVGILLLNDDGHVTTEEGELCLRGPQLMPGYLNDTDLNAQKFFLHNDGSTYYRTGDICRLDAEGDLLYVGRQDDQLQVHGFRVELGEIEHVFQAHFRAQFVAIGYLDDLSSQRIALLFESDKFNEASLREFAASKLPYYMVPDRYVSVAEFPLNINQKVDRKVLKERLSVR